MKRTFTIFLFMTINFMFCQEVNNNERQIENLNDYNLKEIVASVNFTKTVYGTFEEKVTLYGTLITPKTSFDKIIIIVSGSGKISQKAHNYLVQFLLENNIAVFRFDKRGVGKSTGKYNDQVQVYTNDFIAIYKSLKKSVVNKKIGFLGHSLGGIITIQAIEKNYKPDFLIQWSAPVGKPRELLKYQIKNGIKNYDELIIGKSIDERIRTLDYVFELIDNNPSKNTFELWKTGKKESKKVKVSKKSFSNFLMPHNVVFARIDNTKVYKEINFPTLVVFGKDDILVDPNQSKIKIKKIGNVNITFKDFDGLNHFMTKKGADQTVNKIYDIDMSFKKDLLQWITTFKN